jgi:hypothetical protein
MARIWPVCFLCIPFLLFAATDHSWQGKQISDWTDDDAHQVLTDSPWALTVTPRFNRSPDNNSGRGTGGRLQAGGMGVGIPGMGGTGRRGGMRTPPPSGTDAGGGTNSNSPPTLVVRWESALPVQAAELKARNVNAPAVDETQYAIAVYGIPSRIIGSDSPALDDQLKGQAAIKRNGKKDLKPSRVEVLPREDGAIVVYFFSRSKEVTRQDKQIEFSAQIARLQFSTSFDVEAMTYQGKLEL